MLHIRKEISIEDYPFLLEKIKLLPDNLTVKDLVFFDIETTGFDPEFSRLTLTGIFYFIDNKWVVEQWFTEKKEDEEKVLQETYNALMYFKKIVTYNGEGFDFPYIENKFTKHKIEVTNLRNKSLDLYPLTKKLKTKYNFKNSKLKTIEKYLGIERKYFIEGEMIVTYYARAIEGSIEHLDELLNYNAEDVIYLLPLLINFSEDYFTDDEIITNTNNNEQISLF